MSGRGRSGWVCWIGWGVVIALAGGAGGCDEHSRAGARDGGDTGGGMGGTDDGLGGTDDGLGGTDDGLGGTDGGLGGTDGGLGGTDDGLGGTDDGLGSMGGVDMGGADMGGASLAVPGSIDGQRLDLASLRQVVFIGDGGLIRIPLPVVENAGSELATIRGRLTRWLARVVQEAAVGRPLEAPDPWSDPWESWYWPDDADDIRRAREADFSVCAHRGAAWVDLAAAVPAEGDGIATPEASALAACMQGVRQADGTLLVVVLLAEYGIDELARDVAAWEGPASLGDVIVGVIERLRDYFEARGFDQVVIVAGTVPLWQVDSLGAGECTVVAADGAFAAKVVEMNEAMAARAAGRVGSFDVVRVDAEVRPRGAVCLDRREERPACNALDERAALVAGAAVDFARVADCCWTAAPSCSSPDRDGHLGIALLFEQVIGGLIAAP